MTEENNKHHDPFNWECNHGVEFLCRTLFLLGHPDESEETLIEVLKEVHKKTDAYIISLEDANMINSIVGEIDFIDDQNRQKAINTRIKARQLRQQQEDDLEDEIPF